jgi:hypothetical protein
LSDDDDSLRDPHIQSEEGVSPSIVKLHGEDPFRLSQRQSWTYSTEECNEKNNEK